MNDENQLDSTSFNKNYKVLKDTAEWLSSEMEPDIWCGGCRVARAG
jgi:hypothetical protein